MPVTSSHKSEFGKHKPPQHEDIVQKLLDGDYTPTDLLTEEDVLRMQVIRNSGRCWELKASQIKLPNT